MRDDEYRKLRRALEEQREADLELIRAGYRAKLHALDMLWQAPTDPGEPTLLAAPEAQPRAETQSQAETRRPAETQGPAATESATRQAVLVGSLQEEVEAILPRLPEVFSKEDIVRTLGWEPRRATLHRALATLRIEKKIAIQTRSRGRHPAQFRKVDAP